MKKMIDSEPHPSQDISEAPPVEVHRFLERAETIEEEARELMVVLNVPRPGEDEMRSVRHIDASDDGRGFPADLPAGGEAGAGLPTDAGKGKRKGGKGGDVLDKINQEKKPVEDEQAKAELERLRAEAQTLVDGYRKFFMTFAGDSSLEFRIGNAFFINLDNGQVNLDIKWFKDRGFSNDQIIWGVMHEIAHFRDMAENPEGTMKGFDYVRDQARKTGGIIMQKWEAAFSASDPEFVDSLKEQKPLDEKKPERGTMNAVERGAYDIHHRFFNIFDDVYVNNVVSREAPSYRPTAPMGQKVRALYQEKLFRGADYSQGPRHTQFVDALLRTEMVPDEEVVVSDEVRQILERKIRFQGREYTPRQIIEQFIKPRVRRDTNVDQRHFVLRKTIEPIYMELLMKDLEEWQPEKPPKGGKGGEGKSGEQGGKEGQQGEPKDQGKESGQEGESGDEGEETPGAGNPFAPKYNEDKANNPDQIGEGDIEDWIKKTKEKKEGKKKEDEKKAAEAKKTPEQRAADLQEKLDADWCAKHGIEPRILKDFRETQRAIEPFLSDLAQLWERIIHGRILEVRQGIEGHFKTGTELDVQKAIEEWPKIASGNLEEVRIMKKVVGKERLVEKPELIRARLVADRSGSMTGDDKKMKIMKQVFVLLFSSLQQFNTMLELERSRTKSKLRVETEGLAFDDDAEVVKRMPHDAQASPDEQLDIIKGYQELSNGSGSTYDHTAFVKILESLTPDDKKKLKDQKIMDLVFEVTDGGSSNQDAARAAVDAMAEAGLIPRSFQIGVTDPNSSDSQIFHRVWNKGREEPWGVAIGDKIEDLTPAVAEALKKYLSDVRL